MDTPPREMPLPFSVVRNPQPMDVGIRLRDDGVIVLEFTHPVDYVAFGPNEALELAQKLTEFARRSLV